jgi:heme A synthase
MPETTSPAPRPARPSTVTLAWATLGVSAFVILQGALVRATGSAAGCGSHWPSCQGEMIPLTGGVATALDLSHRLASLGAFALGAWLLGRAVRERAARPGLLVFVAAAFAFLLVVTTLGAAAVLLGPTGEERSLVRGLMVASHLVTSTLLVGTLAAATVYARDAAPAWPLRLDRQGGAATVLGAALLGMLVLTFSGGIAALGNSMSPSESLAAGLAADFDPGAHPLVRLRMLHPLIAVSVGVYLVVALGLAWWLKPVREAKALAQSLLGVYLVQLIVGTLNLALMAPVVVQLLHLGLAVLAFALLSAISVVLLGAPLAGAVRTHRALVGETA